MNRPSYQELEARIRELECESSERKRVETELLEKQSTLREQNINLVRKSIELSNIKRELEDRNYELESTRSELRNQNVNLVRKSIELSDTMRQLEDRNYDLQLSQTDLRKMLAALHESEERYRELVENANDIIYGTDDSGHFTFVNPVAERMMGYSEEELIGKHYLDLIRPDHRHDAKRFYGLGFVKKAQNTYYEFPAVTRDGTELWLGQNVQLVMKDDRVAGFQAVARDITERKRAEEALKEYSERLEEMVEERTKELRDAQEQLIRQEKLAVLGELAGGVGHELRNPLAAIKNAAYFLNMVLEEPEPEVTETLEILEREVATSERTISSLLDYARTKPPIWRRVDVKEVLHEALSSASVPENVEVVSQLDGRLPIILADPGQLVQVFGNIIRNAVQAMAEGGQLVVRSEVPTPEWVAVSFADTGVGIPEENLGKLFEPLFTTKAKGIGLGMAVTKTLVEGHEGSIEVQSEVGKGSTFTVKLPTIGRKEKT